MTPVARWLLSAGILLFVALVLWQGLPAVLGLLSVAGAGLLLVALFHLLPLVIDAAAIRVLLDHGERGGSFLDSVMTRWVGESANGLMPAGQLGGPVLMVRQLAQRGVAMPTAAAAITVTTTFQMLAQVMFALMGVALLGAHAHSVVLGISIGVMALILVSFYLTQRRGLFRSAIRPAARWLGSARLASLMGHAEAFDQAVQQAYGHKTRCVLSFAFNLTGWLVGTGEVFLIMQLIRTPVTWENAFLLESLGQAIRGAAFAIPGSLGVQEGGYLLLAPLAAVRPEAALALSLAKRAREFLLGIPGLLYLHIFERRTSLADARTARRTIL